MQPCSQPRYGLIERSKPISGESLRAMIVRVASTLRTVGTRPGPLSSSPSTVPQPSSKATRRSLSKRPVSLLAALGDARLIREIIVADGGSRDDSVTIAEAAGARIVEAPRGRGTQLAAGAAAASGDWLLFLHADCRLAPGWEPAVEGFVAAPEAPDRAGYFAFALDD